MRPPRIVVVIALGVVLGGCGATTPPADRQAPQALRFEPNLGQADPRVTHISRGADHTLLLTRDGAMLKLRDAAVRMTYVGAHRQGGRQVPARSVLHGGHEVGFALAGYDRPAALLIDPVLSYSTYLGGSGVDNAIWSDVDRAGSFYVTGFTDSPDFPVTPGALQTENAGGYDVWLAKIAPSKHGHHRDQDVLRAPPGAHGGHRGGSDPADDSPETAS